MLVFARVNAVSLLAAGRVPRKPLARFAVLDSPISGRGAFALRALKPGERIVEYVGERISKSESARRCAEGNPFIFHLDDDWDLDGNVADNPARFFNHSCDPNCEAVDRRGRIWLEAVRDIAPGEELTFNYGYDLDNFEDHPCRCGARSCIGFMVAAEHFETVRRKTASSAASANI